MNTYQFPVLLTCPVDGEVIRIDTTIESKGTIYAERIWEVIANLQSEPMMQEPFTDALARTFAERIITVGVHNGIRITCVREAR